jgi:DNA-binding NarL/FixJ family response regulator
MHLRMPGVDGVEATARLAAERLVVSNATVKTHVNRIFMKIGARDRAQAVRYPFQHRPESR